MDFARSENYSSVVYYMYDMEDDLGYGYPNRLL